MKKIKQLSFVLFIFSVLVFSYPMTQVFAQGGAQCDANPACDPASGTCCNQCDSGPACNANDPNAIPCCGLEEGNANGQDFGQSQGFNQSLEQGGAHVSGNNISGGQCDANPACDPASGTCCNKCDPNAACVADDSHAIPCCSNNDMSQSRRHPYDKGRGDEHHEKGRGDEHHDKGCEKMHPGGASKHIDPPQSQLDIIEAEYEASCKAGKCTLSDESYESLENQGHSRNEVNCFLAEGETP